MRVLFPATVIAAIAAMLVACGNPPGPLQPLPAADSGLQRIVSLAPHLTELVYSAGAGDQLVGVVEYSDYPPAAQQLPLIGDAFRVDLERLSALQPDIVLAWDSGNPAEMVEGIERLGFRVVRFRARTLEDAAVALRAIGALAGTEAIAEAAATRYLAGIDALRATYEKAPRVSVFYQVAERPLYTINGEHTISRMLSLCGGDNIFAGLAPLSAVVSHEAVVLRDPQVMLAGSTGAGDPLADWRRWPRLRAVAENRLLTVDADVVTRASTRMLDGVQQICTALDHAR